MVCLNVRKIYLRLQNISFAIWLPKYFFFWWPRLPTVSNQMRQYCHLSAKLSYLMLMTFDPCNDGLLVIFPGSELLEGIGSPTRASFWGCASLRYSKAILPTQWLSILHPHFQIKISVRQTKVWRSNCSSHPRTLMVSSGVVDSIQSIDLVQMIEGWRQFVKIWRKIHRFIGPGFSGFPLRWFCEVAKIWGTDSANPLDVDDHKDLGTDQFRFPLTGFSTYFCWREKSDSGDRRRVRDMMPKEGALLARSDYRQNLHVFWSSLKTKISND